MSNETAFNAAGTNVTASAGYVNAYTGAPVDPDPEGIGMSDAMKTYYDTELLQNARSKLVFSQLGKRQALPRNHGATVEMRKFNTFAPASQPLQEGVIPPGKQFGMTAVTAAVSQYGDYTTVSDVLEMHAVDPIILGAAEEMGAAAGETADLLCRNELLGGTNVIYAPCPNGDGTYEPVETRSGLNGSCTITPDVVNQAVTMLKKQKAPTLEGNCYAVVIHPSVAYDLRKSEEWIDVHKYASPEEIYNGEIGKLHGCRFIETTNAPVLRGEDLASDRRTLTVSANASAGSSTLGITGGTVAPGSLEGRRVYIAGVSYTVTANTADSITIEPAAESAIPGGTVILPGEGGGDGGAVYATLFFGKDAFCVVDPAGMGMEMIIKPKGEVGGPLEQFSTVGYKFETATAILYQERMVRVESGSAYSGVDEAN